MRSELFKDIVTIYNPSSVKINQKSHFGNLIDNRIELSLIEAAFLLEKGKINTVKLTNQ